MRFATLLTVPLLLTTLTAQEFSDQQRAELRKIIREEIRAAVKELHRTPQPVTWAPAQDRSTAHGNLARIEEVEEVEQAEGKHPRYTFEWTTVAPDVDVKKVKKTKVDSATKKAPKQNKIFLMSDEGKPVEIELEDITEQMKPIPFGQFLIGGEHGPEGSMVLHLSEAMGDKSGVMRVGGEVLEFGPEIQVVLEALGHGEKKAAKAKKAKKAEAKKVKAKKAKKAKAKKAKAKKAKAKKAKAKKAKAKKGNDNENSEQTEKRGALILSSDGRTLELSDLGIDLAGLSSSIQIHPVDNGQCEAVVVEVECCEACEAPACCEAPTPAATKAAPKPTRARQLLR